jgi:hypothetical protein
MAKEVAEAQSDVHQSYWPDMSTQTKNRVILRTGEVQTESLDIE